MNAEQTAPADNFSENPYGLYNMCGNVSEWVWDDCGEYPTEEQTDPVGSASGPLRVYHGSDWNDFAKNMRVAYRATLEQNKGSFHLGIRLVCNVDPGMGSVSGTGMQHTDRSEGANYWLHISRETEIRRILPKKSSVKQAQTPFEITLVNPYSSDDNTVLDEAQRDQNAQASQNL